MRFIPQPTDKQFFHTLADKTTPMIDEMGPHHLLLIFYSAIRLDVECHAFLDLIAKRVMQMEYPFTAATSLITNALFSMALTRKRLGYSLVPVARNAWIFPSEDQFMEFLMGVIKRESRIHKFTDADCARVVYTYAQYQYLGKNDRPFLQTVCNRLAQPQWIMRLNELSSMLLLSSLSTLQLQHPIVDRLLHAMMRNRTLVMYQTSELVTVLYCLGVMQHWNSEAIHYVLDELLKPERMKTMQDQGLANLLYAMGRHEETKKLNRERYLLPFFREAAEKHRVERYVNVGLTGILYSVGLLEYPKGKDSAVLLPLLDELLSPERLKAASTQGVVTSLWGLAKIGFNDRPRFQKLLEECVRPDRMKSLMHHGMGLILYSCGLIQYRNREILEPYVRRVIQEDLTQIR